MLVTVGHTKNGKVIEKEYKNFNNARLAVAKLAKQGITAAMYY